jgi:hypothetical protein
MRFRDIRCDLVLAILPATGVAAAVGILGWLISSLAPLVTAISWLKVPRPGLLLPGTTRVARGTDTVRLIVLAALGLLLTGAGMIGIERRDLHA